MQGAEKRDLLIPKSELVQALALFKLNSFHQAVH